MAVTFFSGPVISGAGFGGGGFSIPVNSVSGSPLYVGAGGQSSIQAAVNLAGPGDTVIVQPGSYDENVVITTDYVTLVGAQVSGYGRPDLGASTGVTLTVNAQGFVARGVRFASQDGSDCVVQEGNGFRYEDCVFDDASDAGAAGLRLKGNADDDSKTASEGVVAGCLFRGCANGILFDTGDAPDNGVGCTDDVVSGCRFYANTLDIATADTGGGVYSVKTAVIAGNYFADKNKATYIDFTTSNGGAASDQTGTVDGNYFASDTMTTTKIKAVGTGFTFVGNYDTVGVFDGSGLD